MECFLQAIDKKGGIPWKPTASRDQLVSMMKEFDLVDVFRERPNKKSYTYESKSLKICSRIDFFLIPRHKIYLVEQIETVISNVPDHKAVKIKFNCPIIANEVHDYGNLITLSLKMKNM